MKKYQIIATLGPAVNDNVFQLIQAGATGFRLNCSHLTWQELSRWLIQLEKAFQKNGDAMPVWLDLQGGKLRIGKLSETKTLESDEVVIFYLSYHQTDHQIPLPHRLVFDSISEGETILLNDGRIELTVVQVEKNRFHAKVIKSGELNSFKGFVFPNKNSEIESVSDRDRSFMEQTNQLKFVGYALSYIQIAQEIDLYRQKTFGRPLTAKIERQEALENLPDIAEAADICWLCRGDLGATANIYELYNYEKKFSGAMQEARKPYLIAGQVLESMVSNNTPSRSEIAHLGFLLENGFVGLVLSDETAVGKYPLEAVGFCREYFEYLV